MKIKSLAAFALFVGAVLLTSCSKEVKIERNLWKKGGEWNIESYDYSSVTTNSSNTININVENCGTMTFNKEGGGSYVINIIGSESGTLTYSNTADQLTLTIDGSTSTYDMTWEKDNITLTEATSTTANGQTTTETETYVLKKK